MSIEGGRDAMWNLVMDREACGVGSLELICERQDDGSMKPVRIERIPPDMRSLTLPAYRREVALERWRKFNEVHGYGQPDGVRHWPVLSLAPFRRGGMTWSEVEAGLRRPPRPTPKQYRLKRRAAGAKRRAS